tara:strand:- start:266 stop:556 length:291 start_codon:yes stop_codon:yes gene_type:complete
MKEDSKNIEQLYEHTYTDFSPIYEKVLVEEGMLRRLATKFAGGFNKKNPLRDKNREHEFAKSAAYELGKDISKSFGGDIDSHTKELYKYILSYITK